MRRWLEAAEYTPGAMVLLVDEMFDHEEATTLENGDGIVRWRNTKDREQTREKCRECVRRLEPILAEEVLPHDFQVASRFKVPVMLPYRGTQRELLLTGEMDLLVIEEAAYEMSGERISGTGFLKVKDLKMTENNDYWKQTYPQLIFYGIACAAMRLGWPVQCSLIQPLCDQRSLPFAFTQEHYTEMWSRIVQVAEYWWNGDHLPKADNAGCAYCPAKGSCPKMVTQGSRRVLGAPVSRA